MSGQANDIPSYITRLVKSSLRAATWPLANPWLTPTLERALYLNLKLQSVSYYWLASKIAAVTHERSLFIGSEIMEPEDNLTHDHFIAFPTTGAMESFLGEFWSKVRVWREDGPRYSQVFFRCAKSDLALQRLEQDKDDNLRRALS